MVKNEGGGGKKKLDMKMREFEWELKINIF